MNGCRGCGAAGHSGVGWEGLGQGWCWRCLSQLFHPAVPRAPFHPCLGLSAAAGSLAQGMGLLTLKETLSVWLVPLQQCAEPMQYTLPRVTAEGQLTEYTHRFTLLR